MESIKNSLFNIFKAFLRINLFLILCFLFQSFQLNNVFSESIISCIKDESQNFVVHTKKDKEMKFLFNEISRISDTKFKIANSKNNSFRTSKPKMVGKNRRLLFVAKNNNYYVLHYEHLKITCTGKLCLLRFLITRK